MGLLQDFKDEEAFREMLRSEKEQLVKGSTATLLKNFNNNLSNTKMSKMMKHNDVVAKKQCLILPGSYTHLFLTAVSHFITVAMCVTVPYYIAFSREDFGDLLVDDIIITCFDSICAVFFALLILLRYAF